jgi:hypothetical protein
MVFNNVRYAPPMEGSEILLKKLHTSRQVSREFKLGCHLESTVVCCEHQLGAHLPRAVNVKVLAKDCKRQAVASKAKWLACPERDEAPGGNVDVRTSSMAETTRRRE